MQSYQNQSESEAQKLIKKLSQSDESIMKMKDAIENMKEQNKILRTELRDVNQLFENKETEWLNTQDELVFEVKQIKRKLSDQESLNRQTNHKLQKTAEKLNEATEQVTLLKSSLIKSQEQAKESMDTLIHKY